MRTLVFFEQHTTLIKI